MPYRLILLMSLCLFSSAGRAADIYQCVQPNGETVFQQQPCSTGAAPLSVPAAAETTPHCQQLAELVQRIGQGYRANHANSSLRQQLAPHYSKEMLEEGLSLFAYAGAISGDDLAVVAQLSCETLTPLTANGRWLDKKSELTLHLGSWQQTLTWPSSWRAVGFQESVGVQLELRYAAFGDPTLRIGCRPFVSGDRLQPAGHHVLAVWTDQLKPGIVAKNKSVMQFGHDQGVEFESKRRLLTATLDTNLTSLSGSAEPGQAAYVAITPQQLCLAVLRYPEANDDVRRQAMTLVSALLSKPKMTLQQYER